MALIEWDKTFSVGVPEFDDQHAELIEIANELHTAMVSGDEERTVRAILSRLVEHAAEHFAFEERQMAQACYSGAVEHRREHRALLAKFAQFQSQIAVSGSILSVHALEFLRYWLLEHIVRKDRALGEFLTNIERRVGALDVLPRYGFGRV